MNRYDEFGHNFQELEMEKRFKDGLDSANSSMEKNIADLEGYLRHLDDCAKVADDNEWKVRYESHNALNVNLADVKAWLEGELAELRWRCHTGSYPDAMNFNLEHLTEYELVRLVKHLERMVNESYTTIRDTEYKLDQEGKEYQMLDDLRRTYKSDVKHCKQTVERMKLEEMMDRRAAAGSPPLYSSNYMKWLDENSLDNAPPPKLNKGKNKNRKLSKDGQNSSKGKSKDEAGDAEDGVGKVEDEQGKGPEDAEGDNTDEDKK